MSLSLSLLPSPSKYHFHSLLLLSSFLNSITPLLSPLYCYPLLSLSILPSRPLPFPTLSYSCFVPSLPLLSILHPVYLFFPLSFSFHPPFTSITPPTWLCSRMSFYFFPFLTLFSSCLILHYPFLSYLPFSFPVSFFPFSIPFTYSSSPLHFFNLHHSSPGDSLCTPFFMV